MKKVLIIIFILSVLDAILTYVGIRANVIEEANPLLQKAFQASPELVSSLIIIFVATSLCIIGRYGQNIKWINWGLLAMVITKISIIAIHFNWIRQVI